MKVNATYEKGVFKPKEKLNIPGHKEIILHFWPENENGTELEKAYAEASNNRYDLEDWNVVDVEGL